MTEDNLLRIEESQEGCSVGYLKGQNCKQNNQILLREEVQISKEVLKNWRHFYVKNAEKQTFERFEMELQK